MQIIPHYHLRIRIHFDMHFSVDQDTDNASDIKPYPIDSSEIQKPRDNKV